MRRLHEANRQKLTELHHGFGTIVTQQRTPKTPMKGKHFAAIEELKEIFKQVCVSEVFLRLKKRGHKCIISEGVTFKRKK